MEKRNNDSAIVGLDEQLVAIYKEICNNIRVTDETSFKLLGTVPLVSGIGSGALTILEKSGLWEGFIEPAVFGLSVLGALITIGLFRWELRNIQKCDWLISRAANFETTLFSDEEAHIQFSGMADSDHVRAKSIKDIKISSIFSFPWGKTQAEKLIYAAAIIAWFIPICIIAFGKITGTT